MPVIILSWSAQLRYVVSPRVEPRLADLQLDLSACLGVKMFELWIPIEFGLKALGGRRSFACCQGKIASVV